MRINTPVTPFVPWMLALASCSSPPQPPTVDESQKRPANAPMAVELQTCRAELQNTRIRASETTRQAEAAATRLALVAAHQQSTSAVRGQSSEAPQANTLFTVRFNFGSARVSIPEEETAALAREAKASPLVMLRGRTDGPTETPAESRLARERAAAVRDLLVAAGVDPARIRATYQPAGDHVADNTEASGRSLNRRVEVEIYRQLPAAMVINAASQP